MKLERCLFDVLNRNGEYLGQAFLARFPNDTTSLISAAHVVRRNKDELLHLVDRAGKRITVEPGTFVQWHIYEGFPQDVAEAKLGTHMGGIPVAGTINPHAPVHYHVSPTHPFRLGEKGSVVGTIVEANKKPVATLGRSIPLRGTDLPLRYESAQKGKKGDSGSALLNERGHVIGVITNGPITLFDSQRVDAIAKSLGMLTKRAF